LIAGLRERGEAKSATARPEYERSLVLSGDNVTFAQAGWMGAIQGLCLPFRGFSRSGATISTGLLVGANRQRAERFSFAMAVIITPLAIAREASRLLKAKLVTRDEKASATNRPRHVYKVTRSGGETARLAWKPFLGTENLPPDLDSNRMQAGCEPACIRVVKCAQESYARLPTRVDLPVLREEMTK